MNSDPSYDSADDQGDDQGDGRGDNQGDNQRDNDSVGVIVPYAELSADALRGVIESFVLREGTDYGHHDVPLESKIADVMRQLERGEAGVVFDPRTASVDVVVMQSGAGMRAQ